MTLLDQPAAVAGVVAEESAWVPVWQRTVVIAFVAVTPVLLMVGSLPRPGVAVVVTAAALASRLVPSVAARRLRRDGRRVAVRRSREHCLTAYVVCGLPPLGGLPLLAPGLADSAAGTGTTGSAGLAVGAVTCLLVVLQHRPAVVSPVGAITCEWLESTALLAILPLLAVATREWWG